MGTYFLLSCTAPPSLSLLNSRQFTHSRVFASPAYHLFWNNSVSTSSTGRIRINFEDELYTDGDDRFDEFGFSGASKQRAWWSNDDTDNWADDGDDDEEDEFWIFKVIRAFGWMVPAIGISLLLGTGTNAFFMALAVPLGQTALSLVIDKVWGSKSSRPKPRTGTKKRTKTRKKPFVRPASKEETSNRKENKTRQEKGSYRSWMAADGSSHKNGGKRVYRFGGWDDLDELQKVPRGTPSEKVGELPKQQDQSKLNQTRRVRDTPLFVRLLIAVFPFLGSWTRFLF